MEAYKVIIWAPPIESLYQNDSYIWWNKNKDAKRMPSHVFKHKSRPPMPIDIYLWMQKIHPDNTN